MKSLLAIALLGIALPCRAEPPPAAAVGAEATITADFKAFDPAFVAKRRMRIERAEVLAKRLSASEARGEPNDCAYQTLFETRSLLISSADFIQIDHRLNDLEQALAHPSADRSDITGLRGGCYDAWWLKLYATYAWLDAHAPDEPKPHSFPAFLKPVDTPTKLAAYLEPLAISNVRVDGVDREREFNDSLATLLQIIIRGRPENYTIDPALRAALIDLVLNRFRDPATAYWGETYVRDGRRVFVPSLSITFHIVSYLKGRVPDLPKVLVTTLAMKRLDYPSGWLWHGAYWNHNDMDVVTLFRLAWPVATWGQKREMADEINRMLIFCLNHSLRPDGSFRAITPDGSQEDAEYYGASFLARIGYFDPANRFWTSRNFPGAQRVRLRILAFARAHASSGPTGDDYRSTIAALRR